jgi:hypothetical protein
MHIVTRQTWVDLKPFGQLAHIEEDVWSSLAAMMRAFSLALAVLSATWCSALGALPKLKDDTTCVTPEHQ